MEPIFIRARQGDNVTGKVATFPLDALGQLEHTARGHVYAVIRTYLWPVAECRSDAEAIALEEAILNEIAATIREHRRLRCPKTPACILDLDEIAASNLAEIRAEEDEAREMARADAMLAAIANLDGETGYDGARTDHTDLECRGGDA
jgi:hypothetical protein